MSLNSVGEPMASPIARPSKDPAAARFTLSLTPRPPWPTIPPPAGNPAAARPGRSGRLRLRDRLIIPAPRVRRRRLYPGSDERLAELASALGPRAGRAVAAGAIRRSGDHFTGD